MHNSERRREFFKSFEAKSLRSRSLLTQISDDLTSFCGSTGFLIFHLFFFIAWITINLGLVNGIAPFDPFPFGLLTTVVSLEAIFLAIFILVSQNRSSFVNTIREEFQMRINLIAEEEITKALELLEEIRKEMGIKRRDHELQSMLEKLDYYNIEKTIIEQIDRSQKPLVVKLKDEFPDLIVTPIKKPIEAIENITKS